MFDIAGMVTVSISGQYYNVKFNGNIYSTLSE